MLISCTTSMVLDGIWEAIYESADSQDSSVPLTHGGRIVRGVTVRYMAIPCQTDKAILLLS